MGFLSGGGSQVPVPTVDPEIEKSRKAEEAKRKKSLAKEAEDAKAFAGGWRGQASLLSPNKYRGFRSSLGGGM